MAVSGASCGVADVEDEAAFLDREVEAVGAGLGRAAFGRAELEVVLLLEVGDGLGAVGLEHGREPGQRLPGKDDADADPVAASLVVRFDHAELQHQADRGAFDRPQQHGREVQR